MVILNEIYKYAGNDDDMVNTSYCFDSVDSAEEMIADAIKSVRELIGTPLMYKKKRTESGCSYTIEDNDIVYHRLQLMVKEI